MRSATSIVAILALALGGCGPSQYLAIPGAFVTELNADDSLPATTQLPTVSVAAGDPALSVGESVTLNVDFSTITELEVTQIEIWVLEMPDIMWIYEITEEEQTAGVVDIVVEAVEAKPSDDECYIPYHQQGYCAQDADAGVTTSILWVTDEAGSTAATLLPVTLDPVDADGGDDACLSFTYDDCCGVDVSACNIDDACTCPDGTAQDILPAPEGTHTCSC